MISVIVCTYNPEENNLCRTLEALLHQDLSRGEWELLIVDNNSSVPVKDGHFVKEHRIRVEFERKQGLSAARECGINHSQGDILVFVDDDNVLAPNYLGNVKAVFENPNIGIVSGAIFPGYEKEPAAWFREWESMLAIRRLDDERSYLTNIPMYNEYFPIGAGMAVRREIVRDYYQEIANGGEYISGRCGTQLSSGEDIDLDFFAIRQGFLVGTVGTLIMKHIIPASRTTPAYISRLAIASTKSAAQVNRKWRNVWGANVFSFFNINRRKLLFRLFVAACLYWLPKFRIRFHFYNTLLQI